MPPRWPRKPDRNDPAFRKLDDRMTFATHVALFAASNSGLWFVRTLQQADWAWPVWVTGGWLAALVAHGIYIFAIADYSDPTASTTSPKGFAKK
ncbi:MAG: 2TM domain-containing protein [Synechococcales cyanobacterium T60_A2020_003]|nr:2TM domain-containing protein [Synechococcales cyanobacterium T60_A2020_003]